MKEKLFPLFVLLAAMLWGTTGTVQTFAPEESNPVAFGAIRLAIGGLSLLIFVSIKGTLKLSSWTGKEVWIAALCMALYQPLFFSAVYITGVAIGTVVAIGSAPIMAGFGEWIMYRRLPPRKWWLATFFAIAGCSLLFVNEESITVDPIGILMALGAGLTFAIYTIINKPLLAKRSPEEAVAVVFTLGALLISPVLFIFDVSWVMQENGLTTSLFLGVIATGLAYLLFAKGLREITASTAVTLSLAEPLTATILGVFIVGELLTATSWIGVSLLLFSIILLAFSPKKNLVLVQAKANRNHDKA
ncbi:EamA family transporter [Aquibacillus halophilus]|uniref:EamA family transporter n=1 Tax=Aquibacillus halophilus TaxID=930132 RepID=A0A6A8DPT9_9BACI|nr:EamA family transporter [Aquibacillus halophilus]MRH45097.1 EamA family transporter [Aquibacillus halophilus]